MNIYFEGDTRPYIRQKKKPNDSKDTVFCSCVCLIGDKRMKCDYEKRIDHHRNAVKSPQISYMPLGS